MRPATEDLTRRIQYRLQESKPDCEMDPLTALLIAEMVIDVIKLLHECQNNAEGATKEVNTLSKRNRKKLKRILRKQLGWIEYWKSGKEYLRAFELSGQTVTVEMMDKLYKENMNAFYYREVG